MVNRLLGRSRPAPERRAGAHWVRAGAFLSGLVLLGGVLRFVRESARATPLPFPDLEMESPPVPAVAGPAVAGPAVVADKRALASGATEPPVALSGSGQFEPVPIDDDVPLLGVLAREVAILSEPDVSSKVLGYARTGAQLIRSETPTEAKGCTGGAYRVEPRGYVCVGPGVTVDMAHPVLQIASVGPRRSDPLPYVYGRSRWAPPLYGRLPQAREAKARLPVVRRTTKPVEFGLATLGPPPSLLEGGGLIPRPLGYPSAQPGTPTHAQAQSAFAFLELFESGGAKYGLTTDLSIIPLAYMDAVEPSEFRGVHLTGDVTLPIAFAAGRKEAVYSWDEQHSVLRFVRFAQYREAFPLEEEPEVHGRTTFRRTKRGELLALTNQLRVVPAPKTIPRFARGEDSWISVSILRQSLVAYRGERPVFVTLVSTGKDGLGDPATTHSTVVGQFRIHTKHVTRTMQGHEADDPFDLRDVPYVQYFHEGYAFHAAFWHDGFGSPRSHGCINLSPQDARYLFHWTDPPVPEKWHSSLSLKGTLVTIGP